MEYVMINESKLKVMLEESDLVGLDLSSDELDYANPEAKQLFGDILGYAREELGFDTSGYRVLLQLYPSRDGGCEIFITRLGKLEEADTPKNQESSARKESQKAKRKAKRRKAFRFECLSHLVGACRRLSESGSVTESEVFTDLQGEWFLILSYCDDEYSDVLDLLPVSELSFLSEYGSPTDAGALSVYLGEYGRAVCAKNAVEIISRL
jgi:negative regulator of genetic competence, sporulation and motility